MTSARVFLIALAGLAGAGCGKKTSPAPHVLTVPGLTLTVPAAADRPDLMIKGRAPTEPLDRLTRMRSRLDAHFTVLAAAELLPEGQQLMAPAELVAEIDPRRLPAGRRTDEVRIVAVAANGETSTLLSVTDGDKVKAPVNKLAAILVLAPKSDEVVLGTPALVMRGMSALMIDPQCSAFINPDGSRVQALAKSDKLSIDDKGVIHMDPALQITPIDETAQLRHADDTLARGGGDVINLSVVYASLLAAKGYTTRLVTGQVAYKQGEVVHAGFHQWAEATKDGQFWYVETLDGPPTKLVPLADARRDRRLAVSRTCERTTPGVTHSVFEAVDANGQLDPPPPLR